MQPYDAFTTKAQAKKMQKQLKTDKKYPVQHVHVRKTTGRNLTSVRLKWVVWIGGKNSRYW